MSFTGKTTYSAGTSLPEVAEDVSDLITINSPHETPLLDAIGDAPRPARATVHEWLEDSLLANHDAVVTITSQTVMAVSDAEIFRVGDIVRFEGHNDIALITNVNTSTNVLTFQRGYGATTAGTITVGTVAYVIGNASLEGADAQQSRFTTRSRKQNYTQIFASTVSISGSDLAVNQVGVRDELAWQKNLRTRELLRDLENSIINGVADATTPAGDTSVRRTMRGLISFIATNQFEIGEDGMPADTAITEVQLNLALRNIWRNSNGNIDLIVVGGREKRAINQFVASNRRFFTSNESYKDLVSVYESDFGVARVVLSRYVPTGTVLMLDSSRLSVLPLAGRHFHYSPLARTGDAENGQVIGEYTLECRNESAHGILRGFTA